MAAYDVMVTVGDPTVLDPDHDSTIIGYVVRVHDAKDSFDAVTSACTRLVDGGYGLTELAGAETRVVVSPAGQLDC